MICAIQNHFVAALSVLFLNQMQKGIAMTRSIRVNTEDLWDAALRYERLTFSMEDIATALRSVHMDLDGAPSSSDLSERAGAINRKAEDLAYRLHNFCAKLRFAASLYEDYDRRVKIEAGYISEDGG